MSGTDIQARKAALRSRLLAARRALSAADRGSAAARVREHVLGLPEVRRAGTVAAYVSVGPEVDTGALLEDLRSGGRRVLLPVVLPDLDLDWAEYAGAGSLRGSGRFAGLREPSGPRLGRDAVGAAEVVIAPGIAADRSGRRLGRGGGSYDRALRRVAPARLVVVLLYDDELVERVPEQDHDCRVDVVVCPSGAYRTRA